MSLFAPERLLLTLGRDSARLARLRRGKVAARAEFPGFGADGAAPELAACLAGPGWQGLPAEVAISDRLVRYWIVEHPAGLASAAELDQLAAARFEQLFGEAPDGWQLIVDPCPGASRWLACALPPPLREGLRRLRRDTGFDPKSVQPHFVSAFNRRRRRLGRLGALCIAGPDAATVGIFADWEWRSVRVHPPLAGDGAALLVRRDALQAGLSAPPPLTLVRLPDSGAAGP